METYVKISFWLHIATIVCGLMLMSNSTYPRRVERGIGTDLLTVILSSFFAHWAWRLVF